MFRAGGVGQHAVSTVVYCAGIGLVLVWLLVFTLVLALVLHDDHQDLHSAISIHNSDMQRLTEEINETTTQVDNALNTLDGELPCLDALCTPVVFDRIVEAWRFLGCWDANSNIPTLVSGVGTQGDMYIVCIAGTTTLDGESEWNLNTLVMYVADENRWARVGSLRTDIVDNGTKVSLITHGIGNALTLSTLHGDNGFNVTTVGENVEFDAVLTMVNSLVRDYNRPPYNGSLNGTTDVGSATNSIALSTPNVTTPSVVREYWTRSGDILEAFITIAFKPNTTGTATVTLDSWPIDIVNNEFGGVGNVSTVTQNSVACSMVLSNEDESITPSPNGTVIDITNDVTDNGCFVSVPPVGAENTTLELWSYYNDIPVSSPGVDAYNHQLWYIRFNSVASF